MKKIVIITTLILIAAIVAIFFSCKKENKDQLVDTSRQKFAKQMHESAKVHNEAMEYVLERLLEIKSEKNKIRTEDEMLVIVENLCLDFVKSHPFFKSDIEKASKGIKIAFNSIKKRNQLRSERTNLWFNEDEQFLSESQKEWLTLVNEVLTNNNNIEQICNELEQIKVRVINEGSEDDYAIIIAVIELGKESPKYWFYNQTFWEELAYEDTGGGICYGWFNWNDCAGDDLAGGVGGAVGGAVVGGMAGGVGAGPGAAAGFVTGAVAASVTNATKQVWNKIFN